MANKRTVAIEVEDEVVSVDSDTITGDESVADGFVLDIISGTKQLKDTPKEQVRQHIARAIWHEYGFSPNDMEIDFPILVNGKRKKADIVIFHAAEPHEPEKISRVIVCRPEPKVGPAGQRIRDYEQAHKELVELENLMEAVDSCQYGLWTNGLELFFLEKIKSRFGSDFEQVGDWPPSGDSIGTREVASVARLRRADPYLLRGAFRRCHNYIHGNEGLPKDAAFWQFLYLIFCKMYDEAINRSRKDRQFWAGPKEQFDKSGQGQKAIKKRIMPLFEEVKRKYANIFRGGEEIILSDRALAFIVAELAKYDFTRTDVDAKGAAYQEIVGANLRGDRGQYFTPRGVVDLAVKMINPRPHERVLDPACGTGGFLVYTLAHMMTYFRAEANIDPDSESTDDFEIVSKQLREYAQNMVFGADFDPFLIKASQMNMVMSGDGRGHLYNINSLEFPDGHLNDVPRAAKEIPLATRREDLAPDIIMTNPPFGADIPITDPNILRPYELAKKWERTEDGGWRNTGIELNRVAPEVLFVERCLQWLKPGGRMAIVLPDGILGNPGTEYIRWWIMNQAWVLASVDLPVEVFIVEANVNILTSLLFLKKKTKQEMTAHSLSTPPEYPIFMAVADKVGFDRRGKPLFKRKPDGEEIIEIQEVIEKVSIGDTVTTRKLRRARKIEDNDLPEVAKAYHQFLAEEAKRHPHLKSLAKEMSRA